MGEVKEKNINGIRFSVAPFRAVEAAKLHPYLLKLLGPFMAKSIGALFKEGLPIEGGNILDQKVRFDGEGLSGAIADLVGQLDEAEYESLLRRMLKNVTAFVTKDGSPLQLTFGDQTFDTSMDIVFTGKIFSVYPVMLFVLEANYPDFLVLVGQGFGSKIKKILGSEKVETSLKNDSEKSEI